jgi:hypothetical protein
VKPSIKEKMTDLQYKEIKNCFGHDGETCWVRVIGNRVERFISCENSDTKWKLVGFVKEVHV